MTELKRPERYVQFESIKPKLKEITEFYTRKVTDYQYRLKQLNEYADELENEISVLKETPKVEVLLDDMAKPLVVVPQIMSDFIKAMKIKCYKPLMNSSKFGELGFTEEKLAEILHWINEHQEEYMRAWLYGYTVEKEKLFYLKHIDFCKTDKHYDWFTIKFSDGPLNHLRVEKGEKPSTIDCKFTQQEIDSMQTGSYEQIEVEP